MWVDSDRAKSVLVLKSDFTRYDTKAVMQKNSLWEGVTIGMGCFESWMVEERSSPSCDNFINPDFLTNTWVQLNRDLGENERGHLECRPLFPTSSSMRPLSAIPRFQDPILA